MLLWPRDVLLHTASFLEPHELARWTRCCRILHTLRKDKVEYAVRRSGCDCEAIRDLLYYLPLPLLFPRLDDLLAAREALLPVYISGDLKWSFRLESGSSQVQIVPGAIEEWSYTFRRNNRTVGTLISSNLIVLRHIHHIVATGLFEGTRRDVPPYLRIPMMPRGIRVIASRRTEV